ncbi:MAG: hypothetical protein ACRDMV_03105 [Streptosporangiales bacterium]
MTSQTPHPGHPPAPGSVDPRELRPRRLWYVIGPVIFVLCCLLAAGVFIWTLYGAFSGLTELGPGKTTVQLTPDEEKTFYSSKPRDLTAFPGVPCQVSGPGQYKPEPVFGSETLTRDGTTWHAILHFHVTKAGGYDVTCGGQGSVRFAIGNKFSVGGLVGGIFAIIAIPFVGFLIGGAIVLVTALRRNGHKKRLLAVAAGPAHPGAPGPWPGGPPPPPPGYPPPPAPGPPGPYGPR